MTTLEFFRRKEELRRNYAFYHIGQDVCNIADVLFAAGEGLRGAIPTVTHNMVAEIVNNPRFMDEVIRKVTEEVKGRRKQ